MHARSGSETVEIMTVSFVVIYDGGDYFQILF